MLGEELDCPKVVEKKEENIPAAKKSFLDACILRLTEKSDPNHNRPLDLEFPAKKWFKELQIESQKDLDDIKLAVVSNVKDQWRWVFEMKNGKKNENKSG